MHGLSHLYCIEILLVIKTCPQNQEASSLQTTLEIKCNVCHASIRITNFPVAWSDSIYGKTSAKEQVCRRNNTNDSVQQTAEKLNLRLK